MTAGAEKTAVENRFATVFSERYARRSYAYAR